MIDEVRRLIKGEELGTLWPPMTGEEFDWALWLIHAELTEVDVATEAAGFLNHWNARLQAAKWN